MAIGPLANLEKKCRRLCRTIRKTCQHGRELPTPPHDPFLGDERAHEPMRTVNQREKL